MQFKIGDEVFFAMHPATAGGGMFIGRLRSDTSVVVLMVGQQFVEMDADTCIRTGTGWPPEGRSWRSTYLKQNPGSLL